ncbi:MAG: glycosyltransferase [Planctomycetota bacterium]|nr:MAG: glycosyltransferase [Planctomycetota bacterium]
MPERSASRLVLVFAKHYAYGAVKTRLAADLGARQARQLYRRLAGRIWRGIADPGWQRWLCLEPAKAIAEVESWLPNADRIQPQVQGDLGERMAAAFEQGFQAGFQEIALLGTDAPAIQAPLLRQSFDLLQQNDAVLVPSLDGGYALMGLSKPCPDLFREIDWSTDRVRRQSLQRAEKAGLQVAETEAVRDLDTIEDLEAFRREGWAWAQEPTSKSP